MEIATVIISVAALIVAWFSFQESRKMRGLEAGRDERQELRDRQDQARLVAAWMCVVLAGGSGGTAGPNRWFLAVENASQVPVYDGEAAVASKYPVAPLSIAMLPPGRTYFELSKSGWSYGQQVEELGFAPRPLTQATTFRVESLTFTDASGDRWSRDDSGRLAEVPESL